MNGSLFSDIVCIADATRKKLLPGAIPTLNLLQKKRLKLRPNLEEKLYGLKLTWAAQVLVNNRLMCTNI